MKIEKLCYFLSVAKHRNFTKAAHECHIAQPAISKQMLSLEKDLGFLLFQRKNRRVELTDAGAEFYQSVSCLMEEYEASIRRVRELPEQRIKRQPASAESLMENGVGFSGIEKLDYFVCAAKHHNFTKAAKECGVAQSAISQQIASLESMLGCNLFRRSGRSVELTAQGELFFADARRLQRLYRQAVENARNVACQREEHHLTIGIPGLQSADALRGRLAAWKKDFPQLEVKLQRYSPEYSRRELSQQLYDAILCYWTPQDEEKEYYYIELGKKPIKVLVSQKNTLAGQPGLSFRQVLDKADKLYMSYDIWIQLRALGLISTMEQRKIQWFHDPDLLLPMGSINQAVVMTTDFSAKTAEEMLEYPVQGDSVELREILLFRSQSRNRLPKTLCVS